MEGTCARFLEICCSILCFLIPSLQSCCRVHRHFARFSCRPGPRLIALCVIPSSEVKPWTSGIYKMFLEVTFWSEKELAEPASTTRMCDSVLSNWLVYDRNGGENPPSIAITAETVFLFLGALLAVLAAAHGLLSLGELCHQAHPYGVVMADGSETQQKRQQCIASECNLSSARAKKSVVLCLLAKLCRSW